MFEQIMKGFKMLSNSPIAITIAIIFAALLLSILANLVFRKGKKKAPQVNSVQPMVRAKEEREESIVGTGEYDAVVVRPGGIVDFTKISKPIGEVYIADASCPIAGPVFIVRETSDKKILDYDPREVEIKVNETPEHAWFATHWDIVPQVYGVLINWWQQSSVWFAAGIAIGTFIFFLGVFGG